MKRRLFIVVPVVSAILLLAVFLVLKSYFNESRILALLQPRLETALGRPVEVTGARLQAWPLSVALQGITIRNPARASSAADNDILVHLQTLQCRVDPGPLLRRKLFIQSLILDSLRVHLQQRADSTWNFAASPGPPSMAPPAAGSTESTPLALTIRSLEIRNAVVEVEQTPTGSAAHIPLAANLRFESNRDRSRVTLEGAIRSDGIVNTSGVWSKLQNVHVQLQPRMQIDVPDSSAKIEALTLQVQDLGMQLAGTLQMRAGLLHGTLQTASQSLQLASVLSLVPTSLAPALQSVVATGLVAVDLQVELRGAELPLVNGSLKLADGSLQVPELPAPVNGIQADIRWQGDRIDIHHVAAEFQQQPLQMRGVIVDPLDAAKGHYEMHLEGALSLEAASAFAELPPGTALRGFVEVSGDARGRVADPESLQLSGKVRVRDAVITTPQSREAVHVDGEALLANEEMVFNNVLFSAGRSKARLSGRAAPIRANALPRIEIHGSAALLDLDEILPIPPAATQQPAAGAAGSAPAKSSTLLPGHPASEIELTLEIAETLFQLAQWSGIKVHATASPSGFQVRADVDSLVRDALHLRVLHLQLQGDSLRASGSFATAHSTLGRVQARNLSSKVRVEGTQVQLQDMTASLYDGSLQGNSTLNLSNARDPQYTLQLDMRAVEAGALLADVLPGGQWMTGKLNGSSTWSSSGAEAQALRSNLSATGKAQASAGSLYRFPLVDALTNTLRMHDVPKLSYRDLGLQFSLAEGRVTIPEVRLLGDDLTAISHGSIDLNGQVDLKLNVTLSAEQTKRAVRGDIGRTVQRLFADPQGRMVLDFNVGGTVKAPQLQADLQSTASRSDLRALGTEELGRLLNDLLPKDKESVGDALRRGLGGLLGKDRNPQAPADSTRKP